MALAVLKVKTLWLANRLTADHIQITNLIQAIRLSGEDPDEDSTGTESGDNKDDTPIPSYLQPPNERTPFSPLPFSLYNPHDLKGHNIYHFLTVSSSITKGENWDKYQWLERNDTMLNNLMEDLIAPDLNLRLALDRLYSTLSTEYPRAISSIEYEAQCERLMHSNAILSAIYSDALNECISERRAAKNIKGLLKSYFKRPTGRMDKAQRRFWNKDIY